MSKTKRGISLLLALVMVLGILPWDIMGAQAAGPGEVIHVTEEPVKLIQTAHPTAAGDGTAVTRAQWLQMLVEVFDYRIEDEIVPDNYYPDLSPEAEYYGDLLTAVYYGLVDVLPNTPLEPEAAATREFAVSTLNACMGYLPEAAPAFAEVGMVTYPDDIQVALELGWFTLTDGAFLPAQPITAEEFAQLRAEAEAYVAEFTITPIESQYTFKDGVIEIHDAAVIRIVDGVEVVTVANLSTAIAPGDKFVVYSGGLAIPYRAETVTVDGVDTVITTSALSFEDAIDTMLVQQVTDADPANYYAAEDAELIFIEEESGQTYTQQAVMEQMASGSKKVYIPKYSKSLELGPGVKFELSVELKNAKVCYDVDIGVTKGAASVWLDTDVDVSGTMSCSLGEMLGDDVEVYIGGYEVPGVGGLGVYIKVDVTGSISVVKKYHMKLGLKVSYNLLKWKASANKIFKLNDKGSSFNAEISATLCLEIKFGLYGKALPVKGYLYGEGGFKSAVRYTTYEEIPGNCMHFAAFLYAEFGAKVEWGMLGWEDELDWNVEVIKEENSPVKLSFHYEDGAQVPACTRMDAVGTTSGSPSKIADTGYTTPTQSPYSGCGSTRGSSSGYGSTGEPIIIYEYTLDDADRATITRYSGNASSLSVPETIDGYPVVAIGSRAFQGRTGLTNVILPDSITSIDTAAFADCSSLRRIALPDELTFIGYSAFSQCRSLSYIEIPASLIDAASWNTYASYGIFYGCTSLKTVVLEKGMTIVAPYLFCGAPAIETIVIPETVTEIGEGAFCRMPALKSIVIPDSVTTIACRAFLECTALESVVFSRNLTTLDYAAFKDCTSMKSVELPDSLTRLSRETFQGCTKLSQVKLPAKLEFIDYLAFADCTSLNHVFIPKTLFDAASWNTYASYGIFYGCTALTDVTLEEGMTIVAPYLFCGAPAIETVTIPDTVLEIGEGAFCRMPALKTIVIPDSVTTIASRAFLECTALESVVFSQNLTTLDYAAFKDCTIMKSVELPDSLTRLNRETFQGCTNLTQVKLPAKLESIDYLAFADCTSLNHVFIPKTLFDAASWNTYASYGIFYGCTALTDVTLEEGMTIVAPYLFCGAPAIETVTIPDTVLEIGEGAFCRMPALKTIVIPDSVTTIASRAFLECTALESVVLSQNLTTLDYAAFKDCTIMESVELPDSLTHLSRETFQGCTKLSQVKLPAKLEFIDYLAFADCTSLNHVFIPKTLIDAASWNGYANYGIFCGCTALTDVTLEEGMTIVAPYLFCGAPAIETVTIPETVTEIGDGAFSRMPALKSIVIPDAVTTISRYAFQFSTGLETVELPESLTTLEPYAFLNCTKLSAIDIPDGIETIGIETFSGCSEMTSAVIPDSVRVIDKYAFSNCTILSQVTLSNGLERINDYAFQNCGLTALVLPESLTTVGRNAFANNDLLSEVVLPGNTATLGDYCFNDCDALICVVIPNSVTKLGSYCFNSCDVLADVSLGFGITAIQAYTFASCPELTSIVIPYYVTQIAANAFKSSAKLARVVVHSKLASIGKDAFSYPAKTVFYGPTGSWTETWCADNGFKFSENTTAATGVTMGEKTLTLAKGTTHQLDFTVTPADFADSIVWRSSNANVVTVDEAGKLTAVGTGTATVRINVGSYSASIKVTVTQAVTRLTLNKRTLELDVPETYQLTATITPTDATNQVLSWTSSNTSAATVDENGLITAVGNGTAVITASTTDGSNLTASCTVTVEDPFNIPVSNIILNESALTLEALQTFLLTAAVEPADAVNKDIVWTSSDDSIAAVDASGNVTGIAKGTAVITATAADGFGASVSCTVTVLNTAYIAEDPAELESPHNYPINCTDFWVYTLPDAEFLCVTFDERTYIEDDFDFLDIYDGSGQLMGSYTGGALAGVTVEIPGDTVKIQLRSDDFGTDWGFKVTAITGPEEPAKVIATGWSGATEWTLTEDGVLTIYGSGKMKNYGYNGGQPWLNKGVDITAVVIEDGVTSIGSGAFRNLTSLKSVTFPAKTLTEMGEAAFYGSGLTSVEIPASLWTIKPYTFKNCADLTAVTFNEGNLQKISDGAFYGTGLTELVLPDCLDILDVYAFKGCAKLTDITIGSGLTELREAVFYGTAIPTITIPEGITKIGPYAFKNCVAMESIDLPESLTSVGEASFYACTGLEEIILPDAVKTIGNYAFRKCAAIEELSFGEELETIGECAFYGCTGLTELVIPDKVTTIKPYAFKTCTGLTSVTLGKSVKTIGEGAFNTCPGLKTIVFPASVTSIGDYCFSGSASLWKLTFQGNAPVIGTGAFKGLNAYAYYPAGNSTYTSANMLNYGGKLTWTAK